MCEHSWSEPLTSKVSLQVLLNGLNRRSLCTTHTRFCNSRGQSVRGCFIPLQVVVYVSVSTKILYPLITNGLPCQPLLSFARHENSILV